MFETEYLHVVLDEDGTIIEFDCTFSDGHYESEEVIGKNWFDVFIVSNDLEKVKYIFSELFNGESQRWKTFQNDIYCKSGKYKYMDFHNEMFTKNSKQYLHSVGVEHYRNYSENTLDEIVKQKQIK